jgi:hypothetical protein
VRFIRSLFVSSRQAWLIFYLYQVIPSRQARVGFVALPSFRARRSATNPFMLLTEQVLPRVP